MAAYLSRVYDTKRASVGANGFTPSQAATANTGNPNPGGNGGGGGFLWGNRTNPQMEGRLGAQDWNAQKAQIWADYQAGKLPSQTQGVNLGPNGLANLRNQQANNEAAYGYDASGNWSLLNGKPDFTDYNPQSNLNSVVDTYNLRPTDYTGSSTSRTGGVIPNSSNNTNVTSVTPSGGNGVNTNTTVPPVGTSDIRNKARRSNAAMFGGAAQYNQFQPLSSIYGNSGGMDSSPIGYSPNMGYNMDFSKALWR